MPATVPTSEEFVAVSTMVGNHDVMLTAMNTDLNNIDDELGVVADKLEELENAPHPTFFGPKVYRPESYLVASDKDSKEYVADWTGAFQRMFADLESHLRTDNGGSVSVCDGYVVLDATSYTLTAPFMTQKVGRAQGLTFRGSARRTTELVYTGSANLFENHDRWMGVTFYDVSFRGVGGNGTMLYSWSSNTGANQDWNFVRSEWRGAWKNGIVLDGPNPSNTNSEWAFDRCTVTGSYAGAWMYSGATPSVASQDQFLNFWFSKCKLEWSGGTLLRFDRGGSITVRDSSIIMTGTNQKVFYAPQSPSAHADSVQHLIMEGCRFEPRDNSNMIVDSTWKGTQRFVGCPDNAWAYRSGNENVVLYHFTNPSRVSFEDCTFAGKHQYTQSSAPSQQSIRYVGCARTEVSNRNTGFWVKDGTSASSVKIHVQFDGDLTDQTV